MSSNKRIWFLAPTVALCSQQFEYIQSQISAVQIKFLSGADGVERWTEQSLWDAVLNNVKIVVSTYQTLLDALTHAFVRLSLLSLVVFDEAHNCVRKYPGAKIMNSFYHPQKSDGLPVPLILGLTASPVMRSNTESLERIEETLDSLCRTPTKNRAELRLQVKLPVLSQVSYRPSPSSLQGFTKAIQSLGQAFNSFELREDPYVLFLIKENSERSQRKLAKVRMKQKTWVSSELKSFYSTSLKIASELGAYAADYFISEVISKFKALVDRDKSICGADLAIAERKYLATSLSTVELHCTTNHAPESVLLISDKVNKLIQVLVAEPPGFAGIIFVQERAVAAVLAHLLSIHHSSRGKFRIGTVCGTSESSNRTKGISEIIDVKSQKHSLSLFKAGVINLLM